MNNMLATFAFVFIGAAELIVAVAMFRNRNETVSRWIVLAASMLLFAETVRRSVIIGFPALTGLFESLVFYAAVISLIVSLYGLQKNFTVYNGIKFSSLMAALVLLAVASSPIAPKGILEPVPALRSGWLVLHVSFSFIGEALFAFSFAASMVYLVYAKKAGDYAQKLQNLDRLAYASALIAYPVFTAGALVFGAIWAEAAWGRWWSWDPKETWALITWLVYTLYLHARIILKKKGTALAWINVLGFLCTMFTLFGVNFLLSGLHAYK